MRQIFNFNVLSKFGAHHVSLYSLIWDFLLSQINIWTTTTWSNVWVVLPKPSWYEFLIGFLVWTPASKYLHLTTFSNICDFIHALIFVTVSKCRKSPKLTNIVICVHSVTNNKVYWHKWCNLTHTQHLFSQNSFLWYGYLMYNTILTKIYAKQSLIMFVKCYHIIILLKCPYKYCKIQPNTNCIRILCDFIFIFIFSVS
jgi:hypothetical protein